MYAKLFGDSSNPNETMSKAGKNTLRHAIPKTRVGSFRQVRLCSNRKEPGCKRSSVDNGGSNYVGLRKEDDNSTCTRSDTAKTDLSRA